MSDRPESRRDRTPPAASEKSIVHALGLRDREHVAIVGGGGKTTLMLALTDELSRLGRRAAATTTTRVRHEEAGRLPTVMLSEAGPAWLSRVREVLDRRGRVFVGERILPLGKVEGISASSADRLFADGASDHVIVEADGSAGHPVKAPAAHEPVIPGTATLVVAVMGLEALGRRFDSEIVFRPDEVRRITGVKPGGLLTPAALSLLFQAPDGLFKGAPASARRVAFLNKADLVRERSDACALAGLLAGRPGKQVGRIVAGSILRGEYPCIRINA